MARVSIQPSAVKPVEVDLSIPPAEGDHVFVTVDITRTGQLQLDQLEAKLYTGIDSDEQVKVIGDILNIVLKPQQSGKRKKPSTILMDAWKAETITVGQLFALLSDIRDGASNPS